MYKGLTIYLERSRFALARVLRAVFEARVHCRSVLSDSKPGLVRVGVRVGVGLGLGLGLG